MAHLGRTSGTVCDFHNAITLVGDLSSDAHVKEVLDSFQARVMSSNPADVLDLLAILNHGSIQPIGKITELARRDIDEQFGVNVGSFIQLVGGVVSTSQKLASRQSQSVRTTVVNVSSLAAEQPALFPSWSIYSAGKAARVAALDCAAAEAAVWSERPGHSTRFLSFSPGPLDTDMQRAVREDPRQDKGTARMFQEMHSESKLLHPAVSAAVCLRLATARDQEWPWNATSPGFSRGRHPLHKCIDIYDVLEEEQAIELSNQYRRALTQRAAQESSSIGLADSGAQQVTELDAAQRQIDDVINAALHGRQ